MTCPRDGNSSPSTVDSSEGGHGGQDVEGVPPMETYYSSHIAAVCESVNAAAKGTLAHSDMSKAEKRRKTNRLSARRSRKRRRDEIEQLEEELRRLAAETEELTAEKGRLQQELQDERSKAAAPQVRQAPNMEGFGLARTQYDTSTQALLQQQLQALVAGGNSRSGYLPHALAPGGQYLQASMAPFLFPGVNSHVGLPTQPPLSAVAGMIGQSPMERNMLALLQNNAFMQAGHQAAAPVPSWQLGLQSLVPNNVPSLSAQQTRDQATLKLLQALSDISSLSANANVQRFAQPQQFASQPDGAPSGQFGSSGSVTGGTHALDDQETRNTQTSDDQAPRREQEDPTSYEV